MTIGDMVGQYRVTQLIGEGGMGEVYKAIDTMIEREVAIKVLRPEIAHQKNLLERFRAEAVTLAKLNHSGIATLYSFTQQGNEFYMILEYVPGKTLESVEQEYGALDYKTAVPLFVKVLESMQPAHEMGIMHRDVKPANIMLTTWGTVKLMDFGIARVLGAARQTREGALVGTMEYIAPERIKGKEGGPAADIYSLGVVLYEMLAGQLPFSNENEFELMRMHLEGVAPTFAEVGVQVPPEIEAVVRKSMAKQEAERFATCDEFIAALQFVAGAAPIPKSAIIALVGRSTVSELGTAGHFSSGENAGVAAGYTTPAATVPESWNPPSAGSGPGSVAEFLRARKTPLIAAAAALAAIGIGIGFGLMSRHGQPSPASNAPPVQSGSALPSAANAATPAPAATPLPNSAATPPQPVEVQAPPVKGKPVELPPEGAPAPKPKLTERQKSLKALDE